MPITVGTPVQPWRFQAGAPDAATALFHASRVRHRGPSLTTISTTNSDAIPVEEPEGNIAVFLKPLIVHDTRKLFGSAQVRLDALITHGGNEKDELFHAKTIRFPRVVDGDDLARLDRGLMVYYGKPSHFLGVAVTLSRDTQDSDDLAAALRQASSNTQVADLLGDLAAGTSPQVATIQVALDAAFKLADLTYTLVRNLSPQCLGLFHGNWLAHKDDFGVGRHPDEGTYVDNDIELICEVVRDAP